MFTGFANIFMRGKGEKIMGFSERLRYFRIRRGFTQRGLGQAMGYPDKSADIRVAQYENGSRHPKDDAIVELAGALGVHPAALRVPDIDCTEGLLHTLFALEDIYGLHIGMAEGEPFMFVSQSENKDAAELRRLLLAWGQMAARLEAGMITREIYDRWRYQLDGSLEKILPEKTAAQKLRESIACSVQLKKND